MTSRIEGGGVSHFVTTGIGRETGVRKNKRSKEKERGSDMSQHKLVLWFVIDIFCFLFSSPSVSVSTKLLEFLMKTHFD